MNFFFHDDKNAKIEQIRWWKIHLCINLLTETDMSHEWTMYAGCKTRKNNAMTWLWPVYHNNVEKLKTAFLFAFLFLFVAIPNCLEMWYEKLKIIDILYTYKSTHENICLKIERNENKKREKKVKDCDILKSWALVLLFFTT